MKYEKENFTIHAIEVREDNIIWIWQAGDDVVVVDPAISKPIKQWINTNNLNLHAVLQTHHHSDHIGGTKELLESWPSASVIASKDDIKRIPFQTHSVSSGDELLILGYQIKVIGVPGHTSNHIAYFLSNKAGQEEKCPVLFCGDTLFGGGCGRLFEGSPKEMFDSLCKLKLLPLETKIYCAHEYTEDNLRWANKLFPDDYYIETRMKEISRKRSDHILSLPSSLEEELKTNLFLRAKDIIEFAQLRRDKDHWNG